MPSMPSYRHLSASEWDDRIARADTLASPCRLCPRSCGVNRADGETGFCGAGAAPRISSIFAHHGEEPPISGSGGSGTVFFSYCTLRCLFCQNYQLSHDGEGREYTTDELAERLVWLESQGCHNINLVTATHYLPWWLRALRTAVERGLSIPVVYNCGGYESLDTIEILRGIVDIWLPDMKYGTDSPAKEYSSAPDYVAVNRAAVRAMFRQCGALRTADNGIAYRGTCIRHLVLPDNRAGSVEIARWLAGTFDPQDITISLMAQYRPLHRAGDFPPLNRRITAQEYAVAREAFEREEFLGFYQEVDAMDESYVIDFTQRKHERLSDQ